MSWSSAAESWGVVVAAALTEREDIAVTVLERRPRGRFAGSTGTPRAVVEVLTPHCGLMRLVSAVGPPPLGVGVGQPRRAHAKLLDRESSRLDLGKTVGSFPQAELGAMQRTFVGRF